MELDICPTCKNLVCDCPADTPEWFSPTEIDFIPEDGREFHTPLKTCEICNKEGDWFKHDGMYMCPDCRNKEMELEAESDSHADERVAELRAIEELIPKDVREVDTTLKVKEEFFNTERISIVDKKREIDSDGSITEKHYILAAWLKERMLNDRSVLFDLDEARVKVTSRQRSDQQYMNDLAIKISKDKREELKLKDLEYKPTAPVIKERKTKPKKPKFDKREVFRLAKETGIPEFAIQTVCVSKNIQPIEAIAWIKENQG